jgi:hypothetical protein
MHGQHNTNPTTIKKIHDMCHSTVNLAATIENAMGSHVGLVKVENRYIENVRTANPGGWAFAHPPAPSRFPW